MTAQRIKESRSTEYTNIVVYHKPTTNYIYSFRSVFQSGRHSNGAIRLYFLQPQGTL